MVRPWSGLKGVSPPGRALSTARRRAGRSSRKSSTDGFLIAHHRARGRGPLWLGVVGGELVFCDWAAGGVEGESGQAPTYGWCAVAHPTVVGWNPTLRWGWRWRWGRVGAGPDLRGGGWRTVAWWGGTPPYDGRCGGPSLPLLTRGRGVWCAVAHPTMGGWWAVLPGQWGGGQGLPNHSWTLSSTSSTRPPDLACGPEKRRSQPVGVGSRVIVRPWRNRSRRRGRRVVGSVGSRSTS